MGIMSFDWCFFRIWFNEFCCEDMVNEKLWNTPTRGG